MSSNEITLVRNTPLTAIHHLPDELLDRYLAICSPAVREPLRRLMTH
ncbi:hypothetical protein [Kushneria phosphatilytica]|nr:hypothetical protein [Kushneria phosphatilytica]